MAMRYAGPLLALSLALTAGCDRQPAAATCPVAQQGAPGDLRETPDQQRATAAALGDGDENAIATAAAAVHERHPSADTDAIANYLVVAYCPTIASKPGMDDREKDQAVAAFAERARRIVAETTH